MRVCIHKFPKWFAQPIAIAAIAFWASAVAVWAQPTPTDAITQAIADSGVFPEGTSVVSVNVDGVSAVVELSPQAAVGLTDTASDEMVKAIVNALSDWEGITSIEVTVAGLPLWQYLPPPTQGAVAPAPAPMMMRSMAMEAPTAPTSSELAGKMITLHPSHGSYASSTSWYRAMRTLCGPNPAAPRPSPWTGSTYQPSTYYYYTMGYQWPSFYEDDMSPETIRFLEAYLKSSGAEVWVSRNLDKNAGNFDAVGHGYPAAPFPLPKWQTAAKYYLEDRGDVPASVWNTSDVSTQSDKDLRARAYYANYRMEQGGYAWQDCLSFSLHSNAAGAGTARGTETYWYTSMYPYLQTAAKDYCADVENRVINAIRALYDGLWANSMYDTPPPARVEWPSGTYYGYQQNGTSSYRWQDRGVKTSNFGEVRECKMPAQLMELAFHDDWKFYPDHVFLLDQIFRSTVAWGIYEGMCQYWNITPKARLAATATGAWFPAWVQPGAPISGSVTMQNLGQAWCWGDKFDAATEIYAPYTVWKLAAVVTNQIVPMGTKLEIAAGSRIYPGDSYTFTVAATAPAEEGMFTGSWQMLKDDTKGGAFGDIVTATIGVDGTAPLITIASPAAVDYPYGVVSLDFSATDALSGVAILTATLDGSSVTSGQTVWGLALGAHTLTVTAIDNAGNVATQSVTFNIVNTPGKTTVGGWITLALKKATCGMTCQYDAGSAAPTGSVTFQDHDTGMTVKSIDMIALGIRGNAASFHGTCTIDGEAGHWFRIDVVDNGEPGSNDQFDFYLDTGYHVGGTLGGGNITIQ